MDDRYDREERRHDSGRWGDSGPKDAPAAGEFPWRESSGSEPGTGWDTPAVDDGGSDPPQQAPAGQVAGSAAPPGNGMAVAGFVLSIIALILCWLSLIDLIFVLPAIVFSAIGLRRANRQNRPRRGLAIAGLSISLVAAVIMIVLTVIYVGVASNFAEGNFVDDLSGFDRIEELDDDDLDELYRRCEDYYTFSDGFEQDDPALEHWCGELRDRYGERYDFDF